MNFIAIQFSVFAALAILPTYGQVVPITPSVIITYAPLSQYGEFQEVGQINGTVGRGYYFVLENLNMSSRIILTVGTGRANDSAVEHPIYVNVMEPGVLVPSFQVPYKVSQQGAQTSLFSGGSTRTLCLLGNNGTIRNPTRITIMLTTEHEEAMDYNLGLFQSHDFLLSKEHPITANVFQNSPVYFAYEFVKLHDGSVEKYVRVSVYQQYGTECLTVSIQPLSCPVFDLEENVYYKGQWETLNSTAVLTVERSPQYEKGFVVVIVVNTDDEACNYQDPFALPLPQPVIDTKDAGVRIEITVQGHEHMSSLNIIVNMLLPVVLTIGVAAIAWHILSCRNDWIRKILDQACRANGEHTGLDSVSYIDSGLGSTNDEILLVDVDQPGNRRGWGILSLLMEGSIAPKTLTDFNNAEAKESDNRYYTLSYIIAPYYVVPVCQFAIYYYRTSRITGNYDICYYNFRCANKVGFLADFNHFWSNAIYIFLGIAYLIIISYREKMMSTIKDANKGLNIPFGMLRALGVSLIMEGVLSASYHLCPNQSTFQFDTCFMYIIAVLLMFTLHHLRHPVLVEADGVFLILVAFLVIPVAGYLIEALLPWFSFIWIFIIVQYITLFLISFNYCVVGFVQEDTGDSQERKLVTGLNIFRLKHLPILQKVPWQRYILPMVCILASTLLLIFSKNAFVGFPSYLLYLLIANVLILFTYYCILKNAYGEFKDKAWVIPSIYFGLAIVLGTVACYCFLNTASEWELSPSESREKNRDCYKWPLEVFPGFYDSHDVWHFFSAVALFLVFMGLLVLDDDLIATPKESIHVF